MSLQSECITITLAYSQNQLGRCIEMRVPMGIRLQSFLELSSVQQILNTLDRPIFEIGVAGKLIKDRNFRLDQSGMRIEICHPLSAAPAVILSRLRSSVRSRN